MAVLFRLDAVRIVVPVLDGLAAWKLFPDATSSVIVFVAVPVFRHLSGAGTLLAHGRKNIAETAVRVIDIVGVIVTAPALKDGIVVKIGEYRYTPAVFVGGRGTGQQTIGIIAVVIDDEVAVGVDGVFPDRSPLDRAALYRDGVAVPVLTGLPAA